MWTKDEQMKKMAIVSSNLQVLHESTLAFPSFNFTKKYYYVKPAQIYLYFQNHLLKMIVFLKTFNWYLFFQFVTQQSYLFVLAY